VLRQSRRGFVTFFIDESIKEDHIFYMRYLFETKKVKIYGFRYPSQEKRVVGYCVRPKKNGRHPILIWNRGGTESYGSIDAGTFANVLIPFAEQGFTVYASNLGVDDTHDISGTKDVEAMIRFLKLEKKPLFVAGHSRGCMTTWTLLARNPKLNVRAVACSAGIADYTLLKKERPGVYDFIKHLGGDVSKKSMERRSGIRLVSRLPKIPYLLIHGDQDRRALVHHSIDMAERLAEEGRDVTLKIRKGYDHGYNRKMKNEIQKIARWFFAFENKGSRKD